jgi:cbb3-type cytochrome oxidase subunit 3
MSVIPLTIFFSLLLAGLFIALFAHEQRRRRFASAERDSLLPLADEQPRAAEPAHGHDDHDHEHDHDHAGGKNCGCRDGSRPPCVGCLKRLAPADSTLSPRTP